MSRQHGCTIMRVAKRPVIPSVRLGKAVRFRPSDVQKFIEDMTRNILHGQLNGVSEW